MALILFVIHFHEVNASLLDESRLPTSLDIHKLALALPESDLGIFLRKVTDSNNGHIDICILELWVDLLPLRCQSMNLKGSSRLEFLPACCGHSSLRGLISSLNKWKMFRLNKPEGCSNDNCSWSHEVVRKNVPCKDPKCKRQTFCPYRRRRVTRSRPTGLTFAARFSSSGVSSPFWPSTGPKLGTLFWSRAIVPF